MTTETPVAPGPAAMLGRLRAEIAAQEDKSTQALLLHECGLLAEQAGDEPGAAREFLSAFNADPQFREPLEALVRILTRRKSMKNLGKLLEALTRAASTSEERARAFWERASFLQDYEQNLAGAREALEEAIASNPEDATAWLELEVLSAKEGNADGRLRALEARAELASDAAWKALLFVDLALLTAKAGSTERAYELLDAASALEGRMRFRTQVALETVAAAEDNAEALARALESQADLVAGALEDASFGDENGVPGTLRTPAVVADLWYRAAELKRRGGDHAGWAALVQRAAGSLPASQVLGRARIAALEVLGDVEGAAQAARDELERGASGGGAAALWLRVAESAALASDREAATKALEAALEADPACVPARALALDLASDGGEPKALALALEAQAAILGTPAAKARSFVVAAFVHAVEAGDVAAGKAAMAKTLEHGASPLGAARIARVLAALAGDAVWYEEATRALLAAGGEPGERTSALIELARSRLLHGDLANASEVLGMLAQDESGRVAGSHPARLRPRRGARRKQARGRREGRPRGGRGAGARGARGARARRERRRGAAGPLDHRRVARRPRRPRRASARALARAARVRRGRPRGRHLPGRARASGWARRRGRGRALGGGLGGRLERRGRGPSPRGGPALGLEGQAGRVARRARGRARRRPSRRAAAALLGAARRVEGHARGQAPRARGGRRGRRSARGRRARALRRRGHAARGLARRRARRPRGGRARGVRGSRRRGRARAALVAARGERRGRGRRGPRPARAGGRTRRGALGLRAPRARAAAGRLAERDPRRGRGVGRAAARAGPRGRVARSEHRRGRPRPRRRRAAPAREPARRRRGRRHRGVGGARRLPRLASRGAQPRRGHGRRHPSCSTSRSHLRGATRGEGRARCAGSTCSAPRPS
jgi:tetratricopeptide (TPR) repeat protein